MFGIYLKSCFEIRGQNGSHKISPADLDSPRRDLSVCGLGFVVALLDFLRFFNARLQGEHASFKDSELSTAPFNNTPIKS